MSVSKKTQKQVLIIATIASLAIGVYFLRGFLPIIFFALIMSYLFTPMFRWFRRRTKRDGTAASLTFLASMFLILTPLAIIIFFTVIQLESILKTVTSDHTITFNDFATELTNWINQLLTHVPGEQTVSHEQVNQAINDLVARFAEGFIDIVKASVGGIAGATVSAVLYIYIFLNLLRHQSTLLHIVRRLNPLGDDASNTYLQKMGDTTTAMVRGQFVIAVVQGFAEALILQIAGVHHLFFFMFLIFTVLSIIPLGAGIVAIPVGIIMILTGNVWQGIWVLFGHFAIVTNVDNVLRPRLVPKKVRLNSALTMLAVFAGLSAFGFLGIVIGPVIMILIVTTVSMYLEAQGHLTTKPKEETA